MTVWWNDLSERERLLVVLACLLALVLVMSLFVVRPLTAWRAASESDARQARDAYELVAAAAAVSGGDSGGNDTAAQTPLRQVFVSTAAASGVELIRIGAENDGRLEIQIAPVDGDAFFNWVSELQDRYGIVLTFADIARGDAGQIVAQVLVFERQ